MSLALGASRETLVRRAELLALARRFFAERGVLEVETAALSTAAVPDPAIESIRAELTLTARGPYYLHTSPEYAMKRLLAAGSGDIYQLGRVFRDGEIGRWHQPEFVLLEWYRVGWDEVALMSEVEALLARLLPAPWSDRAGRRLTYRQAFLEHLDFDPFAHDGLAARLTAEGIDVPAGLSREQLLDLALSAAVAPRFARDALTFVCDFPASHAALARLKPGSMPVAARFEVFAGELELANGFAELTDGGEQRRRFDAELERRRRAGRPLAPLDEDFLAALAAGLPECAGVALGFDRVVALAAGVDRLADAVALAHEEPSALSP